MKTLMTTAEYELNISEIKKLFVDLRVDDLTPDAINDKICTVQNNFNKISSMAIDSINNLHLAKTLLEASKMSKDLKYNAAMISEQVGNLKSADIREAMCAHLAGASYSGLTDAMAAKLDAEAYHDSVMFVHENLKNSVEVLREKIRLFQGMLYLDPSRR